MVARLVRDQKVVGSNPATSTMKKPGRCKAFRAFFVFLAAVEILTGLDKLGAGWDHYAENWDQRAVRKGAAGTHERRVPAGGNAGQDAAEYRRADARSTRAGWQSGRRQ